MMFKSKAEFKRAPMVSKYYDLEDSIGVASRLKELQDMKLRVEEAENRAKNIRGGGWLGGTSEESNLSRSVG